ncbi:MAG: hypothetical protein MK165_13590 [Pirellulaceae bacterium]|nr:hypothetical protein [Pirellulaceae bacterium]
MLVPLEIHRLVCSIRGVPPSLVGLPFSPGLLLAGLSAVVAFLFPQGSWDAALFVTPWMLVTWFLALTGMRVGTEQFLILLPRRERSLT